MNSQVSRSSLARRYKTKEVEELFSLAGLKLCLLLFCTTDAPFATIISRIWSAFVYESLELNLLLSASSFGQHFQRNLSMLLFFFVCDSAAQKIFVIVEENEADKPE